MVELVRLIETPFLSEFDDTVNWLASRGFRYPRFGLPFQHFIRQKINKLTSCHHKPAVFIRPG
jgi:hypothetical protein